MVSVDTPESVKLEHTTVAETFGVIGVPPAAMIAVWFTLFSAVIILPSVLLLNGKGLEIGIVLTTVYESGGGNGEGGGLGGGGDGGSGGKGDGGGEGGT